MIVDLVHIINCEEQGEGVYARDELNIQTNAPSPLLPQSSVQKGRVYFQDLTVKAPL